MRGFALLNNIMYVVCGESSVIKMYTADTLSLLDDAIHVKGMREPRDIVACRHHPQLSLYVAEYRKCIWRVSADDHSYVKWLPTDSTTHRFDVYKLSTTSRGILVTSCSRSLCEYSTADAQLLRAVSYTHLTLPTIYSV